MKLSFNKKPVYNNTQLNIFSADIKRGDVVWWNGEYPVSESEIKKTDPCFAVVQEKYGTKYVALRIEGSHETRFVFLNSLLPAPYEIVYDLSKLVKGDTIYIIKPYVTAITRFYDYNFYRDGNYFVIRGIGDVKNNSYFVDAEQIQQGKVRKIII